jgi:hypothetical protein
MGFRSKVPVVLPALLTLVRAAPLTAVQIYDGPFATGDPSDAIHIGYDGDPDSDTEAVTSDQAWAGLGAKSRDETITITSAVYLLNGAADVATARARGYELLAAVEEAIHPLPAMGLTPPTWAGVTNSSLIYIPTATAGLELWLRFWITVRTRL